MTTWHKQISNPSDTPWLDWIEEGIKVYEGRLNKGDWSNMKVGDTIIFTTTEWDYNKSGVKVEITKINQYDTFGDAFRKHGCRLVPIPGVSSNQVDNLYSRYFPMVDVLRYGVLAIKVKVVAD